MPTKKKPAKKKPVSDVAVMIQRKNGYIDDLTKLNEALQTKIAQLQRGIEALTGPASPNRLDAALDRVARLETAIMRARGCHNHDHELRDRLLREALNPPVSGQAGN